MEKKAKVKRVWAACCPYAGGGRFIKGPDGERIRRGTKMCPYCRGGMNVERPLEWKLVPATDVSDLDT